MSQLTKVAAPDILHQVLGNKDEYLISLPVRDLLADDASLRMILDVIDDRLELLSRAISFLQHLPASNIAPIVLVDCDVLRTYVEFETVFRKEASDVVRFFNQTSVNYALPLGAFQEFESQIHGILGFKESKTSPIKKGDVDPVNRLATLLGIDARKLIDEGDDSGVSEVLEKSLLRLARLVFFCSYLPSST